MFFERVYKLKPILIFYLAFFATFAYRKELKIATWNIQNLFDMQKNGTEYKEYVPYTHGWNQRRFRQKLTHLSEVICDLDADVIALQEVENDNALRELQKRLKKSGCNYRYRAITNRPNTPVHNAILSRVKISQKSDILIKPNGRYRSILKVKLQTEPSLYIFVNHWKSLSGPESERVIYAKALMRAIKKLPKGSEYILLGDFNSDWNEYRRMDKKHNDTGGISGINQILKTTIKNHTIRCSDLKRYKEYIHCNLWTQLPSSQRWSHNFFGEKMTLDSIIIPPTLLDGKGWDYKIGSFSVFKPKYLFGKYGWIKRWEIKNHRHTGRGYSDHLPIYALFENRAGFIYKITHLLEKKSIEPQSINLDIETIDIDKLLDKFESKNIRYPLLIKDALVIFKRGKIAVIQQNPQGRAIVIYGNSYMLEEGRVYDLRIYKIKRYKGMAEIIDFEIAKKGKYKDVDNFIKRILKTNSADHLIKLESLIPISSNLEKNNDTKSRILNTVNKTISSTENRMVVSVRNAISERINKKLTGNENVADVFAIFFQKELENLVMSNTIFTKFAPDLFALMLFFALVSTTGVIKFPVIWISSLLFRFLEYLGLFKVVSIKQEVENISFNIKN